MVIICEENAAQGLAPDSLVRVAQALRQDLLGLAADPTNTVRGPDVRMLLLAATLGPAMVGVLSRRIGMAYEWLLWSVTDGWAIDGDVEMHPGWVTSPPRAACPRPLRKSWCLG